MANVSSFVTQTRAQITAFLNAYEDLASRVDEYNAIGGSGVLGEHFDDEQGVPRTDLDLTKQEFVDAIVSIGAVSTLMGQGHNTNLYKAKG
jgi:hypothetical protein